MSDAHGRFVRLSKGAERPRGPAQRPRLKGEARGVPFADIRRDEAVAFARSVTAPSRASMRARSLLPLLLVSCAARPPAVTAAPPPPPPPRAALTPPAPPPDAAASAPVTCTAPSPAAVTADAPGCPALSSLTVVHRWQPDDDAEPCGPPTWVASFAVSEDAERYFPTVEGEPTPDLPRYRALTDAEAQAAGIPLIDTPLWVFTRDNAAPCQATRGRAWASERSGDGRRYVEVARALHGCALPADAAGPFYALVWPQRPAACRFRAMPPRVTRGLAGLPAVRARTVTRPCAAPRCRFSWSRAALTEHGGTVDDVQTVYVFTRRDLPECSWPRDWYHALTWTPRPGAPWAHLLAAGPAVGVFTAPSGVQAVITSQMGQVEVFPLSDEPGLIYPAQARQWTLGDEGDLLGWTIQPNCR